MVENNDRKLNEAGGRLFEFMTKRVLQSLFSNYRIEWQPKGIDDVIIQPDLAIYSETEQLLAIGFCAHATAVNAAGMKVERSIEELFEIKETHEDVLSLSFIWHSPNGWARSQLHTMDSAFDYSFVAFRDCQDSWDAIEKKMVSVSPKMVGKNDMECESIVDASGLVELLTPYFTSLKMLMENRSESNHSLWRLVRKRYRKFRSSKPRTVHQPIKAALIPLLWVPGSDVDCVLGSGVIRNSEKYEPFVRLGGGRVDLSGRITRSGSIVYLASRYPRALVLDTIKHLHNADGITTLINTIGSKPALDRRLSRIEQAVRNDSLFELCRASELKTDLDYTGNSWVLAICAEWIKIKIDQKFGLFEAQRESISMLDNRFKTEFSIISYLDGDFAIFDDLELLGVCKYLTRLLAGKNTISARELSQSLKTESLKKKKHNPLHWLIAETLQFYGIPFTRGYDMFSVFSDRDGTHGNGGKTTFQFCVDVQSRKTIIHALSTYSSTHKDVEFAAKSRLLHYIKTAKGFEYLSDCDFVFVLDGDWPDRSVPMLERSGVRVVPIIEFPLFAQTLSVITATNTRSVMSKNAREDDGEILEAAEKTKGYGKKK